MTTPYRFLPPGLHVALPAIAAAQRTTAARLATAAQRTTAALLALALTGCVTVPGASVPPPLPIGVRAEVEERPYEVRGRTHQEIARSLTDEAHRNVRGGSRGYHEWNINWRFRYAPRGQRCAITSSSVNLRSVTTLPRWVDRERADSALIAEWDRYIGALRTHENGHRDIGYRAAAEIQRTLRRFQAATCTSISSTANRVARDILDRRRRENHEYDEKTRHGATQGASWRRANRGSDGRAQATPDS